MKPRSINPILVVSPRCGNTILIAVFLIVFGVSFAFAQVPNVGGGMVPNNPYVKPPNSIDITLYGASAAGSSAANATAIQNAVNAAVTQGKALSIPSLPAGQCYNFTAGITISGNLTIYGDSITGVWTNKNAIPTALQGSALCYTANGSPAFSSTTTAVQVNIFNVGVQCQTLFSINCGDGFNFTPSGTNQGLSYSIWQNVMVLGHGGNSYARNLTNPIGFSFYSLQSWGGGAFNYAGTAGTYHFGNFVDVLTQAYLIAAGTANGGTVSVGATQTINIGTFVRPIIAVSNALIGGVTPPTNAQYIYKQDATTQGISVLTPDFETDAGINSPIQMGGPAVSNYFDWLGGSVTSTKLNAPTWTTSGILINPTTRTFNDLTSSGTVAVAATSALPGGAITATSATTYTNYATLYLGVPSAGTNVTMTSPLALYAAGAITATSAISNTAGGMFIKGNSQLNTNNSTATTSIGNGTTSGLVTIGGASNETDLSSATLKLTALTTDATHTDRSVCQDSSSNQLFFGSGTLGICLGTSSARFKHDIKPLDAGLDQIMKLETIAYRLNEGHGDPNKTMYGFTAEQGEKVLPALAGQDEDGKPSTFDYLGVVPVLVKGMQQLKAENDNLRACNDNWKCRLFGIR